MKEFLLVFEDRLDVRVIPEGRTSKPVSRRVLATSKENLIKDYGLISCKNSLADYYWDGKVGDVVISIYEIPIETVTSKDELNRFVHQLHCDWY